MLARQVSTAARELKSKTFQTSWLSDPATYPILVIMSFATGGCTGFMTYKFMYCNDVRVSSGVKGKVIRDD